MEPYSAGENNVLVGNCFKCTTEACEFVVHRQDT
jgi:hypothetical protein